MEYPGRIHGRGIRISQRRGIHWKGQNVWNAVLLKSDTQGHRHSELFRRVHHIQDYLCGLLFEDLGSEVESEDCGIYQVDWDRLSSGDQRRDRTRAASGTGHQAGGLVAKGSAGSLDRVEHQRTPGHVRPSPLFPPPRFAACR